MSRIAAVVLAAGRSSRFAASAGGAHKLLADFGGEPMVRRTVRNALAAGARPVVVVTGHAAAEVTRAIDGLEVTVVHNADFAAGLAASLKTGIAALPQDCAGAVMLLADMPAIPASAIDAVVAAFVASAGRASAVVPTVGGVWAHPVLLGRSLFDDVARLAGDTGARALIKARRDVALIELDDQRLLADADTPEALAAALALTSSAGSSR